MPSEKQAQARDSQNSRKHFGPEKLSIFSAQSSSAAEM